MRIMPFMKRKKGIQFAGAGLDTGGGGGVTDYDDLSNKPQIGGVTLTGNKTLADLGAQSALTFDNVPTANSDNPVKSGGVASALSDTCKMVKIEHRWDSTVSGDEYEIGAVSTLLGLTPSVVCVGNVAIGGASIIDTAGAIYINSGVVYYHCSASQASTQATFCLIYK